VDVLPRFFVPDLQPTESVIALSADESAHLTRVLRLRVGARVLVFDGRGAQHVASIASIGKTTAVVNVLEPFPAAPETRIPIVLAQAVLKGDNMETAIRDATMMGVTAVRPVITQRTVVPRSAADQPGVQTRWHRIAIASAKQCGRAVVPRIEPPGAFEVLLDDASIPCRLILVEPAASSAIADFDVTADLDVTTASADAAFADTAFAKTAATAGSTPAIDAVAPSAALVLIGPEGGWSDDEVRRALAAGFRPLSLGGRTLRAETAPLAALAVLTWLWKL
jgi:16S rRNA (uracil1498-N3)-methyltransferase